MRKRKEEMKSELDEKSSGREFFELNKKFIIEEINLDEEDTEEFKEEMQDAEDEEDFEYDRALYVNDEQEEEEVDFDWGYVQCLINFYI